MSGSSLAPVTLIGHGRFGMALANLLETGGHEVVAWDPGADVPEHRARSLDEALARPGVVIVSVPVMRVREALETVRPHLSEAHLVTDVSSVRTPAEAALGEVLGDQVPWAGSHPLFGPSSIARGDALRTVVCPNTLHPDAAVRVQALYASIGCDTELQTADDHDRAMAYTHALAFFVAKGFLDLGEYEPDAFVPPSFRSLARTLDAVRSDAGHLYYAIERLNPHARTARRGLLRALERMDGELERLDPGTVQAALAEGDTGALSALSIPDLGDRAPELRATRERIDDLDRELVALLARRQAVALRAGRIKGARDLPVSDPAREESLLATRSGWAVEAGLDPAATRDLFDVVLGMSRKAQRGAQADPEER